MRMISQLIAVRRLAAVLFVLVTFCHPATPEPLPQAGQAEAMANLRGTWVGTFQSSQSDKTKLTLVFQQNGPTVTGSYMTAEGGQGVLYGSVQGKDRAELTAEQKSPGCAARFTIQVKVQGGTLTLNYRGQACGKMEEGSGSAVRLKH